MIQASSPARSFHIASLDISLRVLDALTIVGLSSLAALVFLQYDLMNHTLPVDLSMMIYVGQQILRGNPPYATVEIVKTPLAGFVSAAAMEVGRVLRIEDVYSVRLAFLAVTILSVVMIYLIGRDILKSRAAGLLGAIVLLGFAHIGQQAIAGPQPKLLFILLGLTTVWLVGHEKFFPAGVAASLTFLTWQIGALFAGAVLIASLFNRDGEARVRAFAFTLAGITLPIALLLAYLVATNALTPALQQTFGANVHYLGQAEAGGSFLQRAATNFSDIVREGSQRCFRTDGLLIVLGLVGGPGLIGVGARKIWKERGATGDASHVALGVLGATSLGLAAFDLVDYQNCPDLIPLLPFLSIGAGWLVATLARAGGQALARATQLSTARATTALLAFAALALFVYGTADAFAYDSNRGLEAQRQMTREVVAAMSSSDGNEQSIQQLGDAVVLVLAEKINTLPLLHLGEKQGESILAANGEGVAGAIRELADKKPKVITLSRRKESWAQPLYDYIGKNYRLARSFEVGEGGSNWNTDLYVSK